MSHVWVGLAISLVIGATIAALYGLHRLGLWLESKGLLYYRHRSGGGIGNALQPLDRLTRPSLEHVEHVQDEAKLAPKTDSCDNNDRDL